MFISDEQIKSGNLKPSGNFIPDIPKTSLGSKIISGIGNFGTGVVEGIAKGVGKTVLGIAQEQTKKPLVGLNVQTRSTSKSQPVIDSMSEFLEPTGVGQNVGYGLEKGAELLSPTKGIAKAKAITTGIAKGLTGGAPKLVSFATKTLLNSLPEAGLGYLYGKSQGETNEQARKTAIGFGAFSAGGEAIGGAYRALKGNLADNINKAIGVTGKTSLGSAQTRIPKATNALNLIAKSAPDITVNDINSVEKVFDPGKATFYETMQALAKTKQMVYDEYTSLASSAGEHGAKFTAKDFNQVISLLRAKAKDSVGAVKNKVQSLINDLEGNFASINPKDGGHYFKDTPLDRIQKFVEEINKDINPMSDKAGSVVSTELSQALRDILDKKIFTSTGNGYQALRNNYADLKSIEPGIINQWKKSVGKGTKGFGKYIEGYGGLEVLLSILSQNPTQAVRGAGLAGLGKAMSYLRDPEMNLQRAFKLLLDNSPEPATIRAFGGAKPNQAVQQSTEALKANQGGFAKIPGGTKPSFLKGLQSDDIKILEDYIDAVRLKKPVSVELERDAAQIAEGAGVLKGAKTANQLAKNLEPVLTEWSKLGEFPKGKGLATPTAIPVFQGFSDLTTKVLDRLKGKAVTSKQEILNFTNMPEMKQAERDVIRRIADDFKEAKIPVQEFANKVKTELLPLKVKPNYNANYPKSVGEGGYPVMSRTKFENISLPDELRGPVAKYDERLYESPIQTSAGDVHFPNENIKNYFAHTRIEDLPGTGNKGRVIPPRNMSLEAQTAFNKRANELASTGDTRRVIELQSDLFQKGRLEGEVKQFGSSDADRDLLSKIKEYGELGGIKKFRDGLFNKSAIERTIKDYKQYQTELPKRQAELSKLEPYRNTWHERVIREEVKQAAKDGKTKLQFPTGETAMKIEGLGENSRWYTADNLNRTLTPDSMKVGQEVTTQGGGNHIGESDKWIITDVLGDGKFKAVPKNKVDDIVKEWEGTVTKEYALSEIEDSVKESFDISGKVDTNNPIYRFYEKEVGRYLKNKYQAQLVTDAQGVSWWEVAVKKSYAKEAIAAFGFSALGVGLSQRTKLGEKK